VFVEAWIEAGRLFQHDAVRHLFIFSITSSCYHCSFLWCGQRSVVVSAVYSNLHHRTILSWAASNFYSRLFLN